MNTYSNATELCVSFCLIFNSSTFCIIFHWFCDSVNISKCYLLLNELVLNYTNHLLSCQTGNCIYNNLNYLFHFKQGFMGVFMHITLFTTLVSAVFASGTSLEIFFFDFDEISVQLHTHMQRVNFSFRRAYEVEIIHCAVHCETFSSCLL